jgi:hypothetical protein
MVTIDMLSPSWSDQGMVLVVRRDFARLVTCDIICDTYIEICPNCLSRGWTKLGNLKGRPSSTSHLFVVSPLVP